MKLYRILKLPTVMAATGKSRSEIYEDMSLGLFPRQVPTSEGESGRGVGWLESEIAEWQAQRIAERDRRDGGDA